MSDGPRTVAFETSAALGGVALGLGTTLVLEERFAEPLVHARELVPALDRLTREAGWTPADIERIALSIGPGSFTGLRIGLATAKVLARTTGATLVGVSSLDVLAAQSPSSGPFTLVVDARRDSVYVQRYERGGNPPTPAEPFRVLPSAEFAEGLHPADLLVGSGAVAYRDQWPDNQVIEGPERPEATTVLALSATGQPLDPITATPTYGLSGIRPTRP